MNLFNRIHVGLELVVFYLNAANDDEAGDGQRAATRRWS